MILAVRGGSLEWTARRWAGQALLSDEPIRGSEVGTLLRFREGREDKAVRDPLWWTRIAPWTRALSIVVYTPRQILILGNALRLNVPLAALYRVDAVPASREMAFTFGLGTGLPCILSVHLRGRGAERRMASFASKLLVARDEAVEQLTVGQQRAVRSYQEALCRQPLKALWAERPAVAAGEVNEAFLELIMGVARAGHRADVDDFLAAVDVLRWVLTREESAIAARYATDLLWFQLIRLYGRKPSPEELHQLAASHNVEFRRIFRSSSEDHLDQVLQKLFSYPTAETDLRKGGFILGIMVAFGVLSNDPEQSLAESRASLQKSQRKFDAESKATSVD